MLSIFGPIFLKSISDQIISGQYYGVLIQNRGQNRKTKILIWKRITYRHRFRLSNWNQGWNRSWSDKSCARSSYRRRSTTEMHSRISQISKIERFVKIVYVSNSCRTLTLNVWLDSKHRSSRSQMFFKIVVIKTFANFTGKHLCWSLF